MKNTGMFFLAMLLFCLMAGCTAATPEAILTPTPSSTPIPLFLVAGMGTQTAGEAGIPSVEQSVPVANTSMPPDVALPVDSLLAAVDGHIPGATEMLSIWNLGTGDNARIQAYGMSDEGLIWAVDAAGNFLEYPLQVTTDPELQFRFIEDQSFAVIPDSKEDVIVIFAGTGEFGVKPVPVRNLVTLSDGKQVYLEYFSFETQQWETNPYVMENLAPSDEFLAGLDINTERTYTIVENYYVDNYNGAKVAKFENGSWVETSLEERYGYLAPQNPNIPYLPLLGFQNLWRGDVFHAGNAEYLTQEMNVIWTGDTTTRQVDNHGTLVSELDGVFLIRDRQGILQQLLIRLESPDVAGEFGIDIKRQVSENSTQTRWETGKLEELMEVGQQLEVCVYYQAPRTAIQRSWCYEEQCTDEYNAGLFQLWNQAEMTRSFIDSLATDQVILPQDLVLIPDSFTIKK